MSNLAVIKNIDPIGETKELHSLLYYREFYLTGRKMMGGKVVFPLSKIHLVPLIINLTQHNLISTEIQDGYGISGQSADLIFLIKNHVFLV